MPAKQITNSPQDQALKVASKALVRAVGGVEAAEGFCRSNNRRLSEYGLIGNDCFMPIDVVRDLQAVAHDTPGYPQITRVLAREDGFALVKLPTGGLPDGTSVHAATAQHSRKANAVTTELLDALADGHVDPAEARRAMLKCFEAAEELMGLHALLEQIAEVG